MRAGKRPSSICPGRVEREGAFHMAFKIGSIGVRIHLSEGICKGNVWLL